MIGRRALLVATLAVAGCAVAPSAPPVAVQMSIPGVTPKDVRDALVSEFTSNGYALSSANEYTVTFGKRVTGSTMASFLYGSRFDMDPEFRTRWTVVSSGTAVNVGATAFMVTNPGSGAERLTEVTQNADVNRDLWGLLGRLRTAVAK